MRIVFMGSPNFAVSALRALIDAHEVVLVVTQPDKRKGRGKKHVSPPVKVVAVEAGIPVLQPTSARKPEVAEALGAVGADIGVVVAYGKILPKAVLEAFPRGCVNIHGSLLPDYRGAAPIQWAIIKGEVETGITIMQLDEGMDTGPMLLERRIAIADDETAGSLFERMAPIGAELLIEVLAGLETGSIEPRPQDHDVATYAPMLKKEDGVVDWSRPARAVAALIRGVDPWPGAVTMLGGVRVKLFAAQCVDGEGDPGGVITVDADGLRVACGEGAVLIRELQAPGKRRMLAASFAAGRAIPVGTVLGGA